MHTDDKRSPDTRLLRIVEQGAVDEVESFLSELPRTMIGSEDIRRLLKDSRLETRLMGVVRLAQALAFGGAPRLALESAGFAVDYFLAHRDTLTFSNPAHNTQIFLVALHAYLHALYTDGQFERTVQVAEQHTDAVYGVSYSGQYVHVLLAKTKALIRQLKIERARETFDGIDPSWAHETNDHDVVANALQHFATHRFKVAVAVDYEAAVVNISNRDLPRQRDALISLKAAYATAKFELERIGEIDALLQLVESLYAMLGGNADFKTKYESIARGLFDVQQALRNLLHMPAEGREFNLDEVNVCINAANLALAQSSATPAQIAEAIAGLERSEQWCLEHEDGFGLLDVRWALSLLWEKQDNTQASVDTLSLLLDALESYRHSLSDLSAKAALAGLYRSLVRRLCHAGLTASRARVALRATEFRRGLSIFESNLARQAASRRHDHWPKESGPGLLGPRTHYLGFSVLDEAGEIYATLYLANGRAEIARVPLSPDDVRRATRYLEPSGWNRPLWPPRRPTQEALAPLLDIVREAFERGDIQPVDHLCVAADDPVHVVPLHYLPLCGALALDHLTMSRVSSLADATWSIATPPRRPTSALAVFAPAYGERDVAAKRAVFDQMVAVVRDAGLGVTVLDGAVTRARLLPLLDRYSLVHIQAHGAFPDAAVSTANPFEEAGLLLSDGEGLPLRGQTRAKGRHLMSPRDIVESGMRTDGAHVTLSACVSGLGRRGQGGDTIGLELAFRMAGFGSATASHWHVGAIEALQFSSMFYQLWLCDKRSRADAWRSSMLTLRASARDGVSGLNYCAFSLFGDWR